jgi:hypothetical protein
MAKTSEYLCETSPPLHVTFLDGKIQRPPLLRVSRTGNKYYESVVRPDGDELDPNDQTVVLFPERFRERALGMLIGDTFSVIGDLYSTERRTRGRFIQRTEFVVKDIHAINDLPIYD